MVVCIRVGHFYQIKLCDPSQVPQFRFSARTLREILIIATLDSCRDCHNDQPPKENCHGSQLVDWIRLSPYTAADLMAGDQSHKHSDAIYNVLSLDIFTAHHIFCSPIRWGLEKAWKRPQTLCWWFCVYNMGWWDFNAVQSALVTLLPASLKKCRLGGVEVLSFE